MYNSISSSKNQCFSQTNPRHFCRNSKHFKELSQLKGYKIKCRNARCSLPCYQNWRQKHSFALARHLQETKKQYSYTLFRGHLKLPANATPSDHKLAKAKFLRILNDWKKQKSYILEIHAILHIDSPKNAHWDIVAYTDACKTPAKSIILEAWERSGGERSSCMILSDQEIKAASKYASKDTVRIDREPIHLPATQDVLGLDITWSTGGFWRGQSVDKLWSELIKEWLSENPKVESAPILDSNITTISDRLYDTKNNLRRDAITLRSRVPTDPSQPIDANTLAERWGYRPDEVLNLLKTTKGVVESDEWTNGYYLDFNLIL